MTEQTEKLTVKDSELGPTPVGCQEQPAIHSKHYPLFVLEYKAHRVFFRALIASFGFLLLGVFSVGIGSKPNLGYGDIAAAIFLGLGSIFGGLAALELLFFKEIRLYSDRIVKEWKSLGELEVQLKDAKYYVGSTKLGLIVHISDQNRKRYSLTNILFTYSEYGADPADMKDLHRVMSELSGRKMEDFEPVFWGGKKWLMKKGGT